ncbi:MAG: class II aldolase/adducin family protein [Limnochordia bacterium]
MPSDHAEKYARLKEDIVEVGRRIYNLGFVAANDGNISVRVGDDEILTTPTGVSKGFMTPDMIIRVDMAGNKLEGELKPSSELKLHLEVYKQRPDVRAVLHAHPPVATAFAVAGIPLDKPVLPEIVISLGRIPIAKYATPSTEELPASVRPYLEDHDAVLLENHGALTVGSNLFNALFKMEQIEHFAKISLTE